MRAFTIPLTAAFLFAQNASAQSTWGAIYGRHFYYGGETFSNERRGVHDLDVFSLGLLCTDLERDQSHWSGTLSWQRRNYDYRGWLSPFQAEYWGDLQIRVDLLELTFAGRIALSQKGSVTFDIEPVIDFRLGQEVNGVAYTVHAALSDTIRFDRDRAVDQTFSGARLRVGVSGEIPLADRLWLHWCGRIGWGADEWITGRMVPSWDYLFRVGVQRYFGPRLTITPVWE